MAQTQIKSTQILNNDIKREDINIAASGKALITKVVAGTNISLGSTGADAGTGDVTVNVNVNANLSMNDNRLTDLSTPTDPNDATNKEYVDNVVGSQDKFDYDGDDLMPAAVDSKFIFEFDELDDLMPTISGTVDTDFELDGNSDIQPII